MQKDVNTDSAKRAGVREELQMLTGIVTSDLSYMYYLLLRGGSYFKEAEKPEYIPSAESVDTFEDWFNKL